VCVFFLHFCVVRLTILNDTYILFIYVVLYVRLRCHGVCVYVLFLFSYVLCAVLYFRFFIGYSHGIHVVFYIYIYSCMRAYLYTYVYMHTYICIYIYINVYI
jgi:hypothetical protein